MSKMRAIDNEQFGLYLWEMPDGSLVADEEMNWLNIPSERGDQKKIDIITKAVRSYGITEGRAVFFGGRRRVTDEEYEEQQTRLKLGLTPDIYDAGALRDELRARGDLKK